MRANVTGTIFSHLILLASVPMYDFHYYFIENEGSMAFTLVLLFRFPVACEQAPKRSEAKKEIGEGS